MTPQVTIERIFPKEAAAYLENNFKDNRKPSLTAVTRYARQMKSGHWYLSTDAIAFTEQGELVNGQHRLRAIVDSQTDQAFIVIRNFVRDDVKCLDLGRKRMMHERITIGGVAISQPACALLRNCMSNYKGRLLGTVMWADLRHDDMVVNLYKQHDKLLDIFEQWGYMRHGIPGFFCAGAALIFMETTRMLELYERREQYNYLFNELEFGPLTRAAQFLELVTTGMLEHAGTFRGTRDGAAKALYDTWQKRKGAGRYWSGFDQLNLTLNAAYNFSQLKSIRVPQTSKVNPFKDLQSYAPTNESLVQFWDRDRPHLPPEKLQTAFGIVFPNAS